MNTLMLTTNIQKEFWEYKKIFIWVPIILASIIIAAPIFSYMLSDVDLMIDIGQLKNLQHHNNADLGKGIYGFVSVLFAPFMMIAMVVQLYYFIACLYDERRDMSILFWRSLPVSDATSVGVKMFVGALVLPAIFMVAATTTVLIFIIAALVLCAVLAVGYDISLWAFWDVGSIISAISTAWLNLLPYTLWLFPLYAWLMLVSMFSKKAPFLWVILPVVILLLVEGFVVRYFHLDSAFFAHLIIDYFSINHETMRAFSDKNVTFGMVSFSVLTSKINLFGLVIGAGFMYLTYWLRANKSHD